METVKIGQRTAKSKRDGRMEEIRTICEFARTGESPDDPELKEAVDAVVNGEYCVVEWTEKANAAYSIAAQLRKKFTKEDGWDIKAQKTDDEGGVIAALHNG